MRSRKYFLFYTLLAALAVVLDLMTKQLVLAKIPLFGTVEAIPGVFHLTYVQNTGAAFSSFQGMRWLFVGIFLVLALLLLIEYFKKPMPFSTFERFCLASICGGALGNAIDRVRFGYVVDMVHLEFVDFPIFNVADCFITCGSVLLLIHLIFFNKDFWKDEKK